VLTRSAQFVKCAQGAAFLPRLFAHSLYESDPKLGACLEVALLAGGASDLENTLFAEADCVTATGSDETLADIRARLPQRTRFLGYGHRVSFGYITGESLAFELPREQIAARAADDVVAWNQLGCLSPACDLCAKRRGHHGGKLCGIGWRQNWTSARRSNRAANCRWTAAARLPPGAEFTRCARPMPRATPGTRCRPGFHRLDGHSTKADPRFQLSCLNRFVYVKSVPDLKTLLESVGQHSQPRFHRGPSWPMSGESAARNRPATGRWGALRILSVGPRCKTLP